MIYNISDDTFINNGPLAERNPVKLRQYDNRLWAVCDDGALVFSNNGDATTWDPLNIILAPNREPIIDFQPVQGGAILITRTSVYGFYGSGTYQDTSILLIQDRLMLSDSAVQVDNVVYILGNRGVHAVTLNGIKEIPHNQTEYFADHYGAWNALSVAVQGIYLYRFRAILYLFRSGYGAQGFLYSLRNGAFQKINRELPVTLPYMLEMADAKTDFVLGGGDGSVICRSIYPAGILNEFRVSTLQFRHEDADSMREKVWRHLGVTVEVATYNVLLQVYLDHSTIPTFIKSGAIDLFPGDNIFELFDEQDQYLRSHTISIELTIGGNDYLTTDPTEAEPNVEILTTSENEPIISDALTGNRSNFAIREMRLKYCEVGAAH